MKKLLSLLILMALLTSCQNDSGTGIDGQPEQVKIFPTINASRLDTKAQDTYFDAGDMIGLNIVKDDGSVYAQNARMTFNDGIFTGGISWYDDTDAASKFVAYYPYSDGGIPTAFSVKSNQNEGYTTSDLLAAVITGVTPSSTAIHMPFRHLLSKINVVVAETNKNIESIVISNSKPTAKVNIDNKTVTVNQGAGVLDINTYANVANKKYSAIVIPQTAALALTVNTSDGKSYTKKLLAAELKSGYQYTVEIVLNSNGIEIDFTGDIEDWNNEENPLEELTGEYERSAGEPDPADPNNIFVELFNSHDPIPDPAIWKLCEAGKTAWTQHFLYTEGYENVKVEDGYLKVYATKDGDKYKNGGIRTNIGFPNNSRVDIKAKLNRVRGGFPALWQMPVNGESWPLSGEIDIFEWVQETPWKAYQTYHYKPGTTNASQSKMTTTDVTAAWHIYSVERSDAALVFFIDGVETLRYNNPKTTKYAYPFNHYNYDIIINFSLGGYLNGQLTWPGVIVDADLPGEMLVDYVQVSKLK